MLAFRSRFRYAIFVILSLLTSFPHTSRPAWWRASLQDSFSWVRFRLPSTFFTSWMSLSSRVVWHSSLCHRRHFLSLSFWSLILAPVWPLSSVQPKLCSRANQIPYWLMSARITVSYPYNHLRPYNALISSEISPYDWTSLALYRSDTIRITELVLLPQPDTVRMTELISLSQPDTIHVTNLTWHYCTCQKQSVLLS